MEEDADDYPGLMLQQAALYNNTDFMTSLLQGEEQGAVNTRDLYGRTPLYTCVTNSSLECAHMLLQAGADPNVACGEECGRMTPLHAAALDNKCVFVSLLLSNGARMDVRDASQEQPLDLAEKNHSAESASMLLAHIEKQQQQEQQKNKVFITMVLEGKVDEVKKLAVKMDPEEVTYLVDTVTDTHNSLLYMACERADVDMVEFILENNREVSVHPITGHSPLHATCVPGSLRCADAIMKKYPELVRAPTVDGTLPLHAACAEGHTHLVKYFLQFRYPDYVKKIFKQADGDRMYRLGVAVNAKDGSGRTPLHLAAMCGHAEIVDILAHFKVPVLFRYKEGESGSHYNLFNEDIGEMDSPSHSEPDNVDADTSPDSSKKEKDASETFCPLEVDSKDLDGKTPLHMAIGAGPKRSFRVAKILLHHGADPNKVINTGDGFTTPLMEACVNGDAKMIGLLLKYGANDENLKVLKTAVDLGKQDVLGKLLKYRSHVDSEYKLNFQALLLEYSGLENRESDEMCTSGTGTLKSLWPNKPVVVNWHGLQLADLYPGWLLQCCLLHNGKPTSLDLNERLLFLTITRLDISNNQLNNLPAEVFQLPSIRIINCSNNRIQILNVNGQCSNGTDTHSASLVPSSSSTSLPRSNGDEIFDNSSTSQNSSEHVKWNCPMLEELSFHKNGLETLPVEIFKLPSLKKLDASYNFIDSLPYDMWTSPSLTDLNLSHNKLQRLPQTYDPTNRYSVHSLDSNGSDPFPVPPPTTTESPTSSIPGTPLRLQTIPQAPDIEVATFHLQLENGSITTEETDSSTSGCEKCHQEFTFTQFNHWHDKVRVRLSSSLSDTDTSDKQSKLADLKLSHNRFEAVPLGLACLAPNLNRLSLCNNRLSQIGPVEQYPTNLRWLDLSQNPMVNEIHFECHSATEEERWAARTCHSSSLQLRNTRSSVRSTRTGRTSRKSSTTSLQSSSGSPSNFLSSVTCSHKLHFQLEKLKTLRLSHNGLTRLILTRDCDDLSSSGDDSQKSGSGDSRLNGHSNSHMDNGERSRPHLLYPNLSVLEINNNALTALPAELSEQVHMTELKAAHNKLKELPAEMGSLTRLWNLDVTGSQAERNLQAVLGEKARKTAAILGYLKSIKDEATLYNRMKLMLVGVEGIGKTSLLTQLKKEGRSTPQASKNWAQRMGHSDGKEKDLKGENISTVGVDIGDLIIQRNNREIVFNTWDFGGQREYYATHQYFLSKRSLYLVVWRVTDGEKGVNEILQWLVNIQARAPNSTVMIVGTHVDLINKKKYPPNYLLDLQRLILEKYMSHTEPEKFGLPRVVGRIEISCKSRLMYNNRIAELVGMIWTVATEEQQPGNRGCRLLEQKVPATYVYLQDVVTALAKERKAEGKDPVLHAEQYKPLVMNKMEELYNVSCRDAAELNQATQFLHENGVLLHYDDINLQDIYFLDPQWLCDILANVVTIREINSLAHAGIMKTDDLKFLFKNAAFKPNDIKTYVIDLLNKFEVALLYDEDSLLIPSLLPKEDDLIRGYSQKDVRIAVKGCETHPNRRRKQSRVIHTSIRPIQINQESDSETKVEGQSTFYIPTSPEKTVSTDAAHQMSPAENGAQEPACSDKDVTTCVSPSTECVSPEDVLISETPEHAQNIEKLEHLSDVGIPPPLNKNFVITNNQNIATSLVRLYLMSYFPSGFWPRIITRLLGDPGFYNLCQSLYDLKPLGEGFSALKRDIPEWRCWQTGVELHYLGVMILRVKEVGQENSSAICDYRQCFLVVRMEKDISWNALNSQTTSILEIFIPNSSVSLALSPNNSCYSSEGKKSLVLQPHAQTVAALLAKLVDHIDTLLEDWYPDLGVRFVQNSKGMYLITRVVACTRCLHQQVQGQAKHLEASDAWSLVDVSSTDDSAEIVQPVLIGSDDNSRKNSSLTSDGTSVEGDSTDSPSSSISPSNSTWLESLYPGGTTTNGTAGGISNKTTSTLPHSERREAESGGSDDTSSSSGQANNQLIYCYLVEQCLQAAQLNKIVFCPLHGNLGPYFIASCRGHVQAAHLAPDSVFQDIGEQYVVNPDHLTRGHFLGKGAFGAVYAGTMMHMRTGKKIAVAMKMLQPVKPGPDVPATQVNAYKVEKARWDKDPMKNACEAYLNARKELTILLNLKHDNIVPLLGISLHPLCLILRLAPQGALDKKLQDYKRAGARLPPFAIRNIVIQVACALKYLHSCQIIYRDLKSENVLVWSLPPPHQLDPSCPVMIRLADYGVSRSVLPSGTRGLAGTPPFIAPEIIQHNGEETYTEKVDCFSFGMFMYELLVLKIPFDGEGSAAGVANIKGHVLSGGRPPISNKELSYPTHFLNMMTLCWSHDPSERPSASDIIDLATSPEFCHLHSVVPVDSMAHVLCACQAPLVQDVPAESPINEDLLQLAEETQMTNIWVGGKAGTCLEGELRIYTYHHHQCISAKRLPLGPTLITSMCVTDKYIWCADTAAVVHIFSLRDYCEILKFPATTRPGVQIRCMTYSNMERVVYIVVDNGRFIVCETDFPVYPSINYTPVKTECSGNGRPIHCLTVLNKDYCHSELWCGQSMGRISIWDLHTDTGTLKSVCHFEEEVSGADTVTIVTDSTSHQNTWSYVFPGSTVYKWDMLSRKIISSFDLVTLAVGGVVSPKTTQHGDMKDAHCQVTAMCVCEDHLYVATTGGCLAILNKIDMHPISLFCCHAAESPYVSAILPLVSPHMTLPLHMLGSTDPSNDTPLDSYSQAGVITVGIGYNDIVTQYSKRRVSQLAEDNTAAKEKDKTKTYLMSWLGDNWTHTGRTEQTHTTV